MPSPFGRGPFGAGPYSSARQPLTHDVGGLAVVVLDAEGELARAWAALAPCAIGTWQPAEACSAGVWIEAPLV
jgi:hypothetical protein